MTEILEFFDWTDKTNEPPKTVNGRYRKYSPPKVNTACVLSTSLLDQSQEKT